MITLKMNTKVRHGIELILNGEAHPYVDLNNTRYILHLYNWELGVIKWTPFNLDTQTVVGTNSYSKPYASHNTFRDILINVSPNLYPEDLIITELPSFPVPIDTGSVIP